jgi:hypothetical protein
MYFPLVLHYENVELRVQNHLAYTIAVEPGMTAGWMQR